MVDFKQMEKVRKQIYFLVILFGVICIFSNPVIAHADIFGFEVQDIYMDITTNVRETNDILGKAFKFAQVSPYDVVNGISGTTQGNIAVAIRNASKTTALVVATLLLMVEFFENQLRLNGHQDGKMF